MDPWILLLRFGVLFAGTMLVSDHDLFFSIGVIFIVFAVIGIWKDWNGH